MAYSTSNPPALRSQAGTGPGEWVYESTDNAADATAVNYFTNAQDLGMKVGDTVRVRNTGNNAVTIHTVLEVESDSSDITVGLSVGTAT